MMRAINDQMVPHDISPLVVNVFFSSVGNPDMPNENVMNFQTFAALFVIFRRFKKYAEENPIYLNEAEFYTMLSENIADGRLLGVIDSFYLTQMGDLDDLYAGHSGAGEEDFLIQFL